MSKFDRLLKELKERQFQGINSKDEKGSTKMHLAGEFASSKTIKLLIEKGGNVNARNNKGETPLHRAAHKGKVRNVREIIKAGSDVNAIDNNKSTPLHHAVMLGSRGNTKSVVKELIQAGANINVQNNQKRTPLHEAVYIIRDIESIRMLIRSGCDVNVEDDLGYKALRYAKIGDDERVVKMLIEAGERVCDDERICDGESIRLKRKELSEIGEGYKNIKERDIFKERLKEVEKRSYEGINEKNKEGNTLLHLAMSYGNTKVVKQLIAKGADVNIEDNQGRRALHCAALFGKVKIMKILIEKGADKNARENYGQTALHYACLSCKKGAIKELLKAGAGINPHDMFGTTPMKYTKGEIRKLFEKKGGKIVNKSVELQKEVDDICEQAINLLDRLMLPKLKGKVMDLNEIKKRDKELIRKELGVMEERNMNILKTLGLLKKKDEEKDEKKD